MAKSLVIAVILGGVIGIGSVAAQSVVRIYGTTSTGTIVQVLVNASGRLVVWGN